MGVFIESIDDQAGVDEGGELSLQTKARLTSTLYWMLGILFACAHLPCALAGAG